MCCHSNDTMHVNYRYNIGDRIGKAASLTMSIDRKKIDTMRYIVLTRQWKITYTAAVSISDLVMCCWLRLPFNPVLFFLSFFFFVLPPLADDKRLLLFSGAVRQSLALQYSSQAFRRGFPFILKIPFHRLLPLTSYYTVLGSTRGDWKVTETTRFYENTEYWKWGLLFSPTLSTDCSFHDSLYLASALPSAFVVTLRMSLTALCGNWNAVSACLRSL